MKSEEPYSFLISILAFFAMGLPVILIATGNTLKFSESIKIFFTVSVSIGINYVIDSVFKFVEPEVQSPLGKKFVTQNAAFAKILFNTIYISESTGLMIVTTMNKMKLKGSNRSRTISRMGDFLLCNTYHFFHFDLY
ncbi:hypothetical protein ACTGUP_08985 [Streptococcus suis]